MTHGGEEGKNVEGAGRPETTSAYPQDGSSSIRVVTMQQTTGKAVEPTWWEEGPLVADTLPTTGW